MSLWEIALNHSTNCDESLDAPMESTILFVGNKGSGKTSILMRFLDKNENPKPTVALEYQFGRRTRGHNTMKDVAHIWELGGGVWLSKLIDIAITPDTLLNFTLALNVDLSEPSEMWFTIETLLKTAKARINYVLDKMSTIDESFKDKFRERFNKRAGDFGERDLMDPFPVPLIIFGGKYDLFLELEPEKRKLICKTLRFINHYYGGTLQFVTIKQEPLVTRARAVISHHVFGTTDNKLLQTEYTKPLSVPLGQDSFELIGSPPMKADDFGHHSGKTPVDLWKNAFCSYFPQKQQSLVTGQENPALDPQYAEPTVDTARQQKDEELERYRKLSDRRMRDLMQQAVNEGITII